MEKERIMELRNKIKEEYPELFDICRQIRGRLRDNYDFTVALSGLAKGIGKTNLGIIIGILVDDNFNLEKNIAYLPVYEEIERQFNELDRYQVFDIDEAIKVLYKLRWTDKLQQLINEFYTTERKQNKCTLLLIPRFRDLNEQFRNYQVGLRIEIHSRGFATLRLPEVHPDIRDPWFMDENEKRIRGLKKAGKVIYTKDGILDLESKLLGFGGKIEFPALPQEIEDEYLRIHKAMKERQKLFVKDEKKSKMENISQRILYSSFFPSEVKNGVSLRKLSEKYNIPYETFRRNYRKHNPSVEVPET